MAQGNATGVLTFDEKEHKYFLDGRHILNITTILKLANLIDDRWFSEEATVRGSAVHKAILYSIQSDLEKKNLHPIVAPYFEAWEKFVNDFSFEPIKELCEKPQYHPDYFYAGTPDAIGHSKGRPWLVEVKTGDFKTAGYQTAAQENFPEIKRLFVQRFVLKLNNDSTYKLIRQTDESDFEVFKSALNIANLIKQKENPSW